MVLVMFAITIELSYMVEINIQIRTVENVVNEADIVRRSDKR